MTKRRPPLPASSASAAGKSPSSANKIRKKKHVPASGPDLTEVDRCLARREAKLMAEVAPFVAQLIGPVFQFVYLHLFVVGRNDQVIADAFGFVNGKFGMPVLQGRGRR